VTGGFVTASAGSASFAGNIAVGVGGVSFRLDDNQLVVGGAVSSSGAYALNKSGSGRLVLAGANTYSGQTNVTAGILNVRHNTALGLASGITLVSSGAGLEIEGGTGGVVIASEPVSVSGSGVGGAGVLRSVSGANSYGGKLTLQGNSTLAVDSGSLLLSNTSDNITGNGFNLTVGGAGLLQINSAISTGAGSLVKNDAGVLILGNNNSFKCWIVKRE
jgi:autotransporter-associated beta strand protein